MYIMHALYVFTQHFPSRVYIFCKNSFRLNLVLVETTKCIKSVSDFFGIMGLVYSVFSTSTL